jgi:hypothetical protein
LVHTHVPHGEALQRVIEANRRAGRSRAPLGFAASRALDLVQLAVDDARDAGVSWGRIADVMGIARGLAYQRYDRKRRFPLHRPPEHTRAAADDLLRSPHH